MHNPLLLDIIEYFVANGLAQGDGIDCFRDFSPEEPDNIIVLYEYAGSPPVPYDDAGVVHRSVQVTVRDVDADTARERALELFSILDVKDAARRIDFTTERFAQVAIRQPPFKIKIDANHRSIYGFNMGVTTTIY